MQKLENGLLKDIYEKCVNHFISGINPETHVNAYVGEHPLSFAESEFAGKYMDICVQFYNYTKDDRLLDYVKRVAESVIKNQRVDGYIGGLEKGCEWEAFSVWNQAFTIYGLLSYWEVTKDELAFEAAEKSAFYIIDHFLNTDAKILDAPNNGSQHLVMLISVSKLYKLTDKKLYKDFIEYVFSEMRNSDNNFLEFESILKLRSRKAIENFCCLIGMEMYGEMTDDKDIIGAVKKYWNELCETQITETGNGTTGEVWYQNGGKPDLRDASKRPNENCVAVGWAELSMMLFRLEKDAKYLDEIEKTLFNHLIGSLDSECKDFAYYQPNFGKRVTRTDQTAYKCCRYRGYSMISFIPDNLFFEDGDSVIPLIYTNATFENDKIKIKEETNYPFDSKVKFTLDGTGNIKLRIPAWCEKYNVTLNGNEAEAVNENDFVTISGKFSGDEVVIDFNTKLKIEHAVIHARKYCSLRYGNIVLALIRHKENEIFNINIDLTKPIERVYDTNYNLEFKAYGCIKKEDIKIQIVDYASAGKKNENDEYTIWIAE